MTTENRPTPDSSRMGNDVPRRVTEARTKLGPAATAEQVAEETGHAVEDVKKVWQSDGGRPAAPGEKPM